MPEYLSPGVYVEEIEIGSKPIEGVGTSTVGFLGETERGPTEPRLITSWLQFVRVYGEHFAQQHVSPYLPYAVEGFFANSGARCYVARVVAIDAGTASTKLTKDGSNCLTVKAVGEGSWGERIGIKVGEGTFSTTPDPLFKLTVYYWKTGTVDTSAPDKTADIIEVFDDLSVESTSDNYYENKVNGISNLIILSQEAGDAGETSNGPSDVTALSGGGDGTLPIDDGDYKRINTDIPGQRRGLTAFNEIDEITILYAPNPDDNLTTALITHCEVLKDRFAIIDADKGMSNKNDIKPRDNNETKYAAYYYPWIKVYDPLTKLNKLVPPGGHVAGIYARSDMERGVHKAPANEVVKGATALEFQITKGEQDILNPRGVNCIRAFPGRGIRVWGARTLSSNTLWKYINVRRLFIFLEESIEEGTQWVVFEPNNEKLWGRVRATVTEFLARVWRDGALMGTKAEEAFFVKCDRTTMTQDDIDNGRLICLIGVAPVKPAEFVIFRIAQWAGGSSVTE
ncbi:MAG TPA: phage tail sheath family protein [Nitrospirae bacterium]|nr:phage tail sheath family protein [Nitrospirota bacterium]